MDSSKSPLLKTDKNVQDLPSLRKKLGKIMNVIDEIEIKENNEEKNQETIEESLKYKEFVLLHLNEEILNIRLNLRENVENILQEFENKIEEILHSIELKKNELDRIEKNRRKTTTLSVNDFFGEKSFRNRESPITELMNSKEEFQTIKNMALAIMILFFINLMFQDYFENGYFINIQTLVWCFTGVDTIIFTWTIMIFYSYLILVFTKFVIYNKIKTTHWIGFYLIYHAILFIFASIIVRKFDLSFGSSMIIMCECVRIQMKIHSYFRNKMLYANGDNKYKLFIPKWAKEKGFDESELMIPRILLEDNANEIQKYTYFLFCPTLIYRDSYPLRAKTNISFLLNNLLEFFLCIYYTFIMFRIYIHPQFVVIGKEPVINHVFFVALFKTVLPAFLCLFTLFYCVVHSWLNVWSEILRFPDRRFYGDWWNSTDFRQFFRKFIGVNHEWLYNYAYIDNLRFFNEKISRNSAEFIAFSISGILHLGIITLALGFFGFYQFLALFTLSYLLVLQEKKTKGAFNIVFWVELLIGVSFMITIYSREYYYWENQKLNK